MIEALLDRNKTEGEPAAQGADETNSEEANSTANEYLSSFKVATYKYSETHVEVTINKVILA